MTFFVKQKQLKHEWWLVGYRCLPPASPDWTPTSSRHMAGEGRGTSCWQGLRDQTHASAGAPRGADVLVAESGLRPRPSDSRGGPTRVLGPTEGLPRLETKRLRLGTKLLQSHQSHAGTSPSCALLESGEINMRAAARAAASFFSC